MRRALPIIALALCLCLTAACGTEDLLNELTEGQSGADAQASAPVWDDSGSDTAAQPETPVPDLEEDSSSDVQTPAGGVSPGGTDFTGLTAEECVTDDWPDPGVMPRITLDCPGAEAINEAIQEQFFTVAEDPLWELHYECAKGAGRILSIVMVKRANDWSERAVFNLDLATGEALTSAELLSVLGVDVDELVNLELAVLGEEFTHEFGGLSAQMDQQFYDEQYARTTSPDNAELEKLWFSGDGQLCFAGRIYPLAGAEYYEYQLSTGWTF